MAEQKRSGCLTAWLVIMMILNTLLGIVYLVMGDKLQQYAPHAPGWGVWFLAVTGFINLACAIGVWYFKKWGIIVFGVSVALVFVYNVLFISILGAFFGLVGFGILVFLVRPIWKVMS